MQQNPGGQCTVLANTINGAVHAKKSSLANKLFVVQHSASTKQQKAQKTSSISNGWEHLCLTTDSPTSERSSKEICPRISIGVTSKTLNLCPVTAKQEEWVDVATTTSMCRKATSICDAKCNITGNTCMGNVQQMFKARMQHHVGGVKRLVTLGEKSDWWTKHFATKFPTELLPRNPTWRNHLQCQHARCPYQCSQNICYQTLCRVCKRKEPQF